MIKEEFMRQQLILGDCLEIMASVPAGSVDCVIADLPYGITNAKWDCEIPLPALWDQYMRLAKMDCPIILFGSQPFTSKLISSNMEWFRYCWYWEKEKGTGFLNSKHQPLRCIEEICVFYKKRGKYNPQMVLLDKPYRRNLAHTPTEVTGKVGSFGAKITYKEYTHNYPKNILRFGRDNSNRGAHSTQKPLLLMQYLVETYSNPGDTILDNTMGSGTTCLAARDLGRGYIGIENDENIFSIAKNRLGTG